MTNVEKCKKAGILKDVRNRLGAEDGYDNSFDDEINKMSNHGLIAAYCGWHLGDESWWNDLKNKFDALESML